MNKKAFVLLETIVVITVLGTLLIVLYQAFSNVLIGVHKQSLYDNTEYIYKTELIREYLEGIPAVAESIDNDYLTVHCSDILGEPYKSCSDGSVEGSKLFQFLGVKAVYFAIWNIDNSNQTVLTLEPTTQNYIKYLQGENKGNVYRIIVMYTPENKENSLEYEYASLRFKDRE